MYKVVYSSVNYYYHERVFDTFKEAREFIAKIKNNRLLRNVYFYCI